MKSNKVAKLFGKRLRHLRTEHGLTQEKLGFAAELNRTYISDLENGKYCATVEVIIKLAKGLNVPPALLLINPGEEQSIIDVLSQDINCKDSD